MERWAAEPVVASRTQRWDKHRLLHVVENHLFHVGFFNPQFVESSEVRSSGPFEADAEIARYKIRSGLEPEADVGLYVATGVTFEKEPAAGRIVRNLLTETKGLVQHIRFELSRFVAL